MSYVNISLARQQLAVFHNADDALIQQALDAAEAFACDFMNRHVIQDDPQPPWVRRRNPCCIEYPTTTDDSDPVPASVVQAVLLYAADFYEHRTAGSNVTIFKNPAAETLLHFHRLCIGV